jgi:hypothetical protein
VSQSRAAGNVAIENIGDDLSVLTVDFGVAITFSPDSMFVLRLSTDPSDKAVFGQTSFDTLCKNCARRWSALDPTRTRAARPFRVLLWGGRPENEIEIGLQ